jgi:hypothetical protein
VDRDCSAQFLDEVARRSRSASDSARYIPCVNSTTVIAERTVSVSPWEAFTLSRMSQTRCPRRSPAMSRLESRINPMRWVERFTMPVNDLFQVRGEVRVQRGFTYPNSFACSFAKALDSESRRPRNPSAWTHDGYGSCVAFDHELSTLAHASKQRTTIAGGFNFELPKQYRICLKRDRRRFLTYIGWA